MKVNECRRPSYKMVSLLPVEPLTALHCSSCLHLFQFLVNALNMSSVPLTINICMVLHTAPNSTRLVGIRHPVVVLSVTAAMRFSVSQFCSETAVNFNELFN